MILKSSGNTKSIIRSERGKVGVGDNGGKSIERLSKFQKNLKSLKSCKDHWYGGTFSKIPIFCQLDIKNSSSVKVLKFFELFLLGSIALIILCAEQLLRNQS